MHRQMTRRFASRFTIQFVDGIDDGDLVVGDVYDSGVLTKPFVLIRIHLYANELMYIENQIAEIV